MLRVYAAAHGLTSPQHAVVEVGSEEIILRVDTRWTRFTHHQQRSSDGSQRLFALNEDGTVTLGPTTDEMDLAAESVARAMFNLT